MKLLALVCVAIILSEAHSAPQFGQLFNTLGSAASKILNFRSDNRGADGYDFSFESDDGTKREEKGEFVNGVWTVKGVSMWRSPDGMMHRTTYTADDNGYNAIDEKGAFSAGALASLAG
ncbi:pupal cuticle protein 20-like [Cimex lectularius]|uniref:CPR type cuticle protein n=1 Tax=Cimex lectularius TaxID=79782 RepID=A0A8I6R701_CIMLE|nr:pupal cuticle protein 20-like [Cimex lectularius]